MSGCLVVFLLVNEIAQNFIILWEFPCCVWLPGCVSVGE